MNGNCTVFPLESFFDEYYVWEIHLVVACSNGLFFLILESKNTTQFIFLAGEGHLNQTQFWTIMNKGSISIFVHVKLRTHY